MVNYIRDIRDMANRERKSPANSKGRNEKKDSNETLKTKHLNNPSVPVWCTFQCVQTDVLLFFDQGD